jgi:2-hydroxychromene-2-carboxylate isomerase
MTFATALARSGTSLRSLRSVIITRVDRTPTFYYDLMSPYAYLAAERIDRVLPAGAHWQPVLLGGLFKLTGRSSGALGDYERRRRGMAEIERRAKDYGLASLRWPDSWPSSSLDAMRAAVFARRAGREREFAAAAFEVAFGQGDDLADVRHVLAAAERAGLEGAAVQAAIADRSIKDELRAETDAANARGVFGVPTVAVGEELFWGDDRLEEAAAALR